MSCGIIYLQNGDRKRAFAWYFGFLIMPRNVKSSGTHCDFHSIQLPVHDSACEKQDHINISVIEHRHCKLACIRNKECLATIYDGYRSVCMLLPEPCFLLKPHPGHVYQVFQHLCTKWVPNSDDDIGYWIYIGGNRRSFIGRKFIDKDLVVGEVTSGFFAVRTSGRSVIWSRNNYEILVVDASCRVTWVPHDATMEQPIPAGALIGGFLAETNTHLYVSKIGTVVGYYNPLNRMAWGTWMVIYKMTPSSTSWL